MKCGAALLDGLGASDNGNCDDDPGPGSAAQRPDTRPYHTPHSLQFRHDPPRERAEEKAVHAPILHVEGPSMIAHCPH